MMFDYSKLLGKIKERGYTQETLAAAIGMTEATLSMKLNNKAFFKQREIKAICDVLGIPDEEVGVYFFAPKVQKN